MAFCQPLLPGALVTRSILDRAHIPQGDIPAILVPLTFLLLALHLPLGLLRASSASSRASCGGLAMSSVMAGMDLGIFGTKELRN